MSDKILTEYCPNINYSLESYKKTDIDLNKIFSLYIDNQNNAILKLNGNLTILTENDFAVVSKKDITLLSGNALGNSEGFISLNPTLKEINE